MVLREREATHSGVEREGSHSGVERGKPHTVVLREREATHSGFDTQRFLSLHPPQNVHLTLVFCS